MIETSSELLQLSSAIFGKFSEIFGKMFGNVRLAFGTILANLRKFSENCLKLYLTSERSERVRYSSCHDSIKFISSRHRVISSIY